jgi:hypothetical protein
MQMVIPWLEDNRQLQQIKRIGFSFIPIALYLIPLNWIKHQHTICLYKNITGHDCYGCGMTRAILSALHLQFQDAFNYNKLVIVVLPLLIYSWIKTMIVIVTKNKRGKVLK